MSSWLLFGASCLLSLWATAKCADIPPGVLDMECRDRYFIIAVDLSFTGDAPRFEAVDATGVYPIFATYSAECGYTLDVLPSPGHAELRASYFSCHTDNQNDTSFTFHFNMITTNDSGNEVTYALNKTCCPPLPFSPREVTCEVNYMEVSVRSDLTFPSGTKKDDWDAAFSTAYDSATSDWLVMFQREGQRLRPLTLSESRRLGYVFDATDGRLVFRTPYGQPHAFTNVVDGVPVEFVHPILFSRRSWVVLMVDLMAACSMSDGSYSDKRLTWQTQPLPGLKTQTVSMGVNGQLLEQPILAERGYVVNTSDSGAVQISIPCNAEGGFRQRFVMNNVYHEFFVFYLYFEQLFMDEDFVATRLRLFRPMASPLLSWPTFSINQTIKEERIFEVYVGDFMSDVDLVAVKLNGQDFMLPFSNGSSLEVSQVPQCNISHAYILRVPFEDPVVLTKLSHRGLLHYILNINFTLSIRPENDSFYHLSSAVAVMTDVFPPVLEGVCSETGIGFTLDHRPFDYLWQVTIGPDALTSALAIEQGYNMYNDSQSLRLEVPLLSPGYTYENIGLKTFSGSFELLVRNSKTLEVEASSAETCTFPTTEVIGCSADGVMTVVANVSRSITGVNPSRTTLVGITCRPMRVDHSRAMFSFALSTCGTTVKIGRDHVTYENRIVQRFFTRSRSEMVTVQCIYPLAALHMLFSARRFESDYPGWGRIVHMVRPTESLQIQHATATTAQPTTLRTTAHDIWRLNQRLPGYPSGQYGHVFRFLKNNNVGRG